MQVTAGGRRIHQATKYSKKKLHHALRSKQNAVNKTNDTSLVCCPVNDECVGSRNIPAMNLRQINITVS